MNVELTHFNNSGKARMVEVGGKQDTSRTAVARGSVKMKKETLALIMEGGIKKGDVLAVAQVAGIMAAKKTGDLIPMCHNIFITGADISFETDEENCMVKIEARVNTTGKTGVEMEALNSVSIAALTIYDMCKAVDKDMLISDIRLVAKSGGKSGDYRCEGG